MPTSVTAISIGQTFMQVHFKAAFYQHQQAGWCKQASKQPACPEQGSNAGLVQTVMEILASSDLLHTHLGLACMSVCMLCSASFGYILSATT